MALLWSAALLVITGAAVIASSRWLARRLLSDGSSLERLLAQLVLAWCQVVLVAELCGAVHLLYSWSVALVHAGVAVVVMVAVRPCGVVSSRERSGVASSETAGGAGGRHLAGWRRLALGALLVVASVAAALSLGARTADFDTNRYHVVAVAHWLNAHEMWSLPYAEPGDNTATEPSNSELLALSLALPTHDDRLAYVGNVGFLILLVAAIGVLGRQLGGTEPAALLAGTLLMASPAVFETQTHSLMSDAAAAAGITAAVALLLGWRNNPHTTSRLVLAGLALGLGAGSKFVALPLALAVVVFAFALAPRGRRLRAVATVSAATALTGGFWLLRNAVETGNPLFPASLGGRLASNAGAVTRDPVSLLAQLPHHPSALLSWIAILGYSVGPALALAALAPWALHGGASRPLRLVGALAGLMFVIALALPFSGGGAGGSMEVMGASLRFALPALAIAVALSAAALPERLLVCGLSVAAIGDVYYLINPQISARPDVRLDPARAGVALLLILGVLALTLGLPLVRALLVRIGSASGSALVRRPARRALAGGLPARAAIGAAGILVAVPATAGMLRLLPQANTPEPVAQALARAAKTGRPVVLIDVADVRSVLGATLDGRPVSTGAGSTEGSRNQINDPRALLTAIADERPAAVVLGEDSSAVPAPQLTPPPDWRLVGSIPGARVYVPAG